MQITVTLRCNKLLDTNMRWTHQPVKCFRSGPNYGKYQNFIQHNWEIYEPISITDSWKIQKIISLSFTSRTHSHLNRLKLYAHWRVMGYHWPFQPIYFSPNLFQPIYGLSYWIYFFLPFSFFPSFLAFLSQF